MVSRNSEVNEAVVPTIFADYFKFENTASLVKREDYTREAWIALFKNELDNGRPIIIEGRTPDSPTPSEIGRVYGHWWVCDGYNEIDQFHIDYALASGNSRDYYDIDQLGDTYTAWNRAIIGLEPGVE